MFKKLVRLPQAGRGRRQPPPGQGWCPHKHKVGLDGPASLGVGRAPGGALPLGRLAGCVSGEYTLWHTIVQNVRMRTVLLPMCPTDGPMAIGELEGTSLHPGNSLGQGFTSTSTLTHVWGERF